MDHRWREQSTEKKDLKQDLVEEEELRAVALSPEKLVKIEREKVVMTAEAIGEGSKGLRYHVKV
jgi:hypothetical protein